MTAPVDRATSLLGGADADAGAALAVAGAAVSLALSC
jgi:hypothetical protein